MERSGSSSSSLLASATEDEIAVSKILLDLRCMMSLSESLSNHNWGRRRKRSCLEPPPPLTCASTSMENKIDGRRPHIEAENAVAKAALNEKLDGAAHPTTSPNTPLSFSLSESDEKSKRSSKKNPKKRSRKECLDMIDDLTRTKQSLTGAIKEVKIYHDQLKAKNSKLKAIKQEVISSGVNLGIGLPQHYRRIETKPDNLPSTANPTVKECQHYLQPSDDGLGVVNRGGPLGFDLNLPAEESFGVEPSYLPLDVSREIAYERARSADARKKRREKIKTKSTRNMF